MSIDPPRTDVWVDPRLSVVTSAVHGQGFVATGRIEAGQKIILLGGELVTTLELQRRLDAHKTDPDAPYVDTVAVDTDVHLVLPPGSSARYANHSCEPTLWLLAPYTLATRVPVEAGEALTVDYATFSDADGFMLECRCGAATCRGSITNRDWRMPGLQAAYAGHWSFAIQARIDRATEP